MGIDKEQIAWAVGEIAPVRGITCFVSGLQSFLDGAMVGFDGYAYTRQNAERICSMFEGLARFEITPERPPGWFTIEVGVLSHYRPALETLRDEIKKAGYFVTQDIVRTSRNVYLDHIHQMTCVIATGTNSTSPRLG